MHILEVTPYFYPHYGGVESHVLGLALSLQQRGHTVDVLTSRYARMPERETVRGISVKRVTQWLNLFNTPVAPGFAKEIATTEADVVHVHSPPPFTELFATRGAQKAGIPLVITYHCDLELRGRLGSLMVRGYQRFLGNRPLQRAKHIISTTDSYAATSRALWNREIKVVPNAVDTERFHPSNLGNHIRERFAPDNEPLALFVGRLVPHKGIGILVRALSQLQHGRLLVVGDGPYRDWLNQLVRTCGLQERVSFAGPVGDAWLPAYYAACDVVVLPSTSRLEAFGIVGLEGMASGKPLVLSDIPGVRDVITSEEGLLVEPLDPNALAAALQNIWDYPERARQMGVRGRERVELEFAWMRVAEKVETVLKMAISA